jgi:hypothetical protein
MVSNEALAEPRSSRPIMSIESPDRSASCACVQPRTRRCCLRFAPKICRRLAKRPSPKLEVQAQRRGCSPDCQYGGGGALRAGAGRGSRSAC